MASYPMMRLLLPFRCSPVLGPEGCSTLSGWKLRYGFVCQISRHLFSYNSIGSRMNLKSAFNKQFTALAELFGKQCNAIAAQRARRTAQLLRLYLKIYDETTLQRFINSFKKSMVKQKQTKRTPIYALFGACFFSWDREHISEEELDSCVKDAEHISGLQHPKASPVVKTSEDAQSEDHYMDAWQNVIDRSHLKVWRKPVGDGYLHEYKVYGTFYDIPAKAFFNTQFDLDYRKKWDQLVISLDVIDHDNNSGSEIVHWVTYYPYPMYSRDYVYVRRSRIDTANNVLVMTSRAVEHPAALNPDRCVRVNTYNSKMVIKPHESLHQNGFDYVLTYYDDPKAAFPSFAYNWMASTGVPDFVDKLHAAAKGYQDWLVEQKETTEMQLPPPTSPRTSNMSAKKSSSAQESAANQEYASSSVPQYS